MGSLPPTGLTLHHQLAILLGYLLGSIPWGLVLTRMAGLGDIRTIGSGNIGATNVLRTGHKGLAAATLLLDSGKGAMAVGLAYLLAPEHIAPDIAMLAGIGAVAGHNFPVWLRFKGGKGVATSFGTVLAFAWPVGLAAAAVWALMVAIFRISSLGAISAFAAAPFLAFYLADHRAVILAVVLGGLGIARHHENIRRLRAGTEPKIGSKKAAPPPTDGGAQ